MNLHRISPVAAVDVRLFSPAVMLIAVLMACKALYLAFFVTPLWDIPDEFGHYAYARDLLDGRGIPVFGSSQIPAEIVSHASAIQGAEPIDNWIAQHPPLYYVVAALPILVADWMMVDPETVFRAPRVIAAITLGLLVLVFYRIARTSGLCEFRSLYLSAGLGFIPMVSNMASGTNHDIPLLLVSAIAALCFFRFMVSRHLRDAYLCAFWVGVAGGIKMTAWILIPPMFVIYCIELWGPARKWIGRMFAVSALMLVFPAMWMIRNVYYFGTPTYSSLSEEVKRIPADLTVTFLQYLAQQPVFDQISLHFLGLFGWMGGAASGAPGLRVSLMGIYGLPLQVLSGLSFAVFMLVALQLARKAVSANRNGPQEVQPGVFFTWLPSVARQVCDAPAVRGLTLGAAFCLTVWIAWSFGHRASADSLLRVVAWASLFGAAMLSLREVLVERVSFERALAYSVLIVTFFSIVLLWNLYQVYLARGWLGAMHGRYLYPVVPFMFVALSMAVRSFAVPRLVLCSVLGIAVLMELAVWILQVMPFYAGAR